MNNILFRDSFNFLGEKISFWIFLAVVGLLPWIWKELKAVIKTTREKKFQNYQMIQKYFTKKGFKQLKKENRATQDMICNQISFFYGIGFNEIEILWVKNIDLHSIIRILRLRQKSLLDFDKDNNIFIVSEKYRQKFWVRTCKSLKNYQYVLVGLFVIYCVTLLCVCAFLGVNISLLIFFVLVMPVELFLFIRIEERKQVWWFETEGNQRFRS